MKIRDIVCTKETPWKRESVRMDGKEDRIVHLDAREVGEQEDGWPAGDIVTYECPHCGHRWRAELPQ